MIIYKATNKSNGKVYIGATTKTLKERIHAHYLSSRNRENPFFNAIRTHGIDGFNWGVVDTAKTKHELLDKEHQWILFYKNVGSVYNVNTGITIHRRRINTKKNRSTTKECNNECDNIKPVPLRKGDYWQNEMRKAILKSNEMRDKHLQHEWKWYEYMCV